MQSAEATQNNSQHTPLTVVDMHGGINNDKTVWFNSEKALARGVSQDIVSQAIHLADTQNQLINSLQNTRSSTFVSNFNVSEFAQYFVNEDNTNTAKQVSCQWNANVTSYVNHYNTYSTTLSEAQDFLEGIEYHQIPFYALHPNAWTDAGIAERDFAKRTSAFGCESGVFRAEAFISNSYDTYRYSSPEPNPEYLDSNYDWPVWYWPAHVLNGHATH